MMAENMPYTEKNMFLHQTAGITKTKKNPHINWAQAFN